MGKIPAKEPEFHFVKTVGEHFEESRKIFLSGTAATQQHSKIFTQNFDNAAFALASIQEAICDNLRAGFKPTDFPPLSPVKNPKVACSLEVASKHFDPGELCKWLTMFMASGIHPWDSKAIWENEIATNPSLFAGWADIADSEKITDFVMMASVKEADRFCWRESPEKNDILALCGDPGLHQIVSFERPETEIHPSGHLADFWKDAPIQGVTIRSREKTSVVILRDDQIFNF